MQEILTSVLWTKNSNTSLVIKRCFRSLKRTQIKMTPMFHCVTRRIETHVRICVLALLIERVAEIAWQKPWSQIRRQLQWLQVTEFLLLNIVFSGEMN